MNYAIVGKRDLIDPKEVALVETLATTLAKRGYTIVTGGAPGTDSTAAHAAIKAGGKVVVYLPWRNFNYEQLFDLQGKPGYQYVLYEELLTELTGEAYALAKANHPAWGRLSGPVRMLMGRNAIIAQESEKMAALPRRIRNAPEGGTRHAMACMHALGKPCYDLSEWRQRERFENLLAITQSPVRSP